MQQLTARFAFPIDRGSYRFKLRGQEYRMRATGVKTLRLLAEIYECGFRRTDLYWLIAMRDHVRQIQYYNATSVLCLVIATTDDESLRTLAIWLRGRCGGTFGRSILEKYCGDSNEQTRKTVAQALRRMGAWRELREMAQCDPNPRIQRIARGWSVRPFETRMSHFLKNVDSAEVRAVEPSLFVTPELDVRQGRRPKTREYIRMILERIHRLVRRLD